MLQAAAIDGLAFARGAGVIEGRLGVESLPRLAQSGCLGSFLDFVLSGEINGRGKPALRLAVNGSVRFECQRCLSTLDLPVQIDEQLELALSEAEVTAADDDSERVVAGHEMNVAALVEEEILLALPMAPKHEQCSAAEGMGGSAKASSFQALSALGKLNR